MRTARLVGSRAALLALLKVQESAGSEIICFEDFFHSRRNNAGLPWWVWTNLREALPSVASGTTAVLPYRY